MMTRSILAGLAAAAGAGALTLAAEEAAASCASDQLPEHETDPEEEEKDTAPPYDLDVGTRVVRGESSSTGCSESIGCTSLGLVIVAVEGVGDDRTAREDIGYELELAGGSLPEDLSLPQRPVRAEQDEIVLQWRDGATDDQEPVDFSLEIAPVDLGGNRGEPVRLEISDPGSAGGCRASGATGAPLATTTVLWLLAGAWATRRRRGAKGFAPLSRRRSCAARVE